VLVQQCATPQGLCKQVVPQLHQAGSRTTKLNQEAEGGRQHSFDRRGITRAASPTDIVPSRFRQTTSLATILGGAQQ
jgi:hypothetical protein